MKRETEVYTVARFTTFSVWHIVFVWRVVSLRPGHHWQSTTAATCLWPSWQRQPLWVTELNHATVYYCTRKLLVSCTQQTKVDEAIVAVPDSRPSVTTMIIVVAIVNLYCAYYW